MEKKERPDDYWKNYEYYKNKENKELVLNNISTLPNNIIITLYKYNKIYLEDSLRTNLENKIKICPLEISKNKFNYFYYQDYINNEIINYNETIKKKISEPKYDLVYRSRNLDLKIIDNGFTSNLISDDKNNVLMMDFLLFNKHFSIRYDQVEWLFNYCRIRNLSKENVEPSNSMPNNSIPNNFYCVDGWVYHDQCINYEYKIYWDETLLGLMKPTELVGYDFPNKLSNRKIAIEMYMIIASNCPDELLNWNNYFVILEWYKDNKEYFDANTFDEFYKINMEKKSFYSNNYINKIKTNFINQIDLIPNHLINWSGEFVEKYLQNKENINKKEKKAYNQRYRYDYDGDKNKLWEYMCKQELDSSKNIYNQVNFNELQYSNKQEYFKILSRFRNIDCYDDNQQFENISKINNFFSNIFGVKNNKKNQHMNIQEDLRHISMIDFIVYNQFYSLSYEDIGWIIQFCKFEWIESYTGETFNIDGWYFDRLSYSEPSKPNYIIEYKGFGFNDLESKPKTKSKSKAKLQIESGDDDEKINILRFAIQLVNEAPDEYVNLDNYYLIAQWYNEFDPLLQSSRMTKATINYYLRELEKKNNIELDKDKLIIKIDNKMTNKEIISKLYYYSQLGQSTNYNLLLKETKNNGKIDLSPWENLDLIESIEGAQINTRINLNQLDLNNFYESNGKINTLNLISSINTTIKFRFNVHNVSKPDGSLITKEELLAGMYNIAGPTGMGIFQASDKTMGIQEAVNLLEKHDYFDYIKGVRMKTSFSTLPIIDYERYDKSQGEGTFLMVIYNLVRGNPIEKEKLTQEKILEQIEKMQIK